MELALLDPFGDKEPSEGESHGQFPRRTLGSRRREQEEKSVRGTGPEGVV
jgi:hypothetical protein